MDKDLLEALWFSKLSLEDQTRYMTLKISKEMLDKESDKTSESDQKTHYIGTPNYDVDESLLDKELFDDITDNNSTNWQYLYHGTIPKNRASIIASNPGVGKTFLSIEIGKSNSVKKPLYIVTENYDNDYSRYKPIVDKGGKVVRKIDFQNWSEKVIARYQDYLKNKSQKEIQLEQLNPIVGKVFKRFKSLCKENGVPTSSIVKYSKFYSYILLIIELRTRYDLIVIDSLSGLINTRYMTRDQLELLISESLLDDTTLLVLHHTKVDSDLLKGVQDIRESFKSVYILDEIGQDTSQETKTLSLYMQNNGLDLIEKNRTLMMKKMSKHEASFYFVDEDEHHKRTTSDSSSIDNITIPQLTNSTIEVQDEIIKNKVIRSKNPNKSKKPLSVYKAALKVIQECKFQSLKVEEFWSQVNSLIGYECAEKTILKEISELKRKNYISKPKGKKWETIIINK